MVSGFVTPGPLRARLQTSRTRSKCTRTRTITAQHHVTTAPSGAAGIRLGALSDAEGGVPPPGASEATPHRLSLGEQARTVVHVCRTGTLCTSSADHDGVPFGSHVDYVLCDDGRPAMLLAARAAHTINLEMADKCSLFCQPPSTYGQDGCRATITGSVRKMKDDEMEEIRERYIDTHAHAIDALKYPDLFAFHVMDVDDVFFVGGFGVVAKWVGANQFLKALPDPLCFDAPEIVAKLNIERQEDLKRLCRVFLGIDEVQTCNLSGLDRLGFDLRVRDKDVVFKEFRVAFREVVNTRFDVQSALVKTFQEAWEREMGFAESWADDDERPTLMYYSGSK